MKKTWPTITRVSLLFLLSFCGCMYYTYAGHYFLGKQSSSFGNKDASIEVNEKIECIIRNIAEAYGFIENKQGTGDENTVYFGKSMRGRGTPMKLGVYLYSKLCYESPCQDNRE